MLPTVFLSAYPEDKNILKKTKVKKEKGPCFQVTLAELTLVVIISLGQKGGGGGTFIHI